MYRKPSKKRQLIQRSIIISIMFVSVIVIVTGTILFILGYRIDSLNGRLEQNALVQFDSRPTGALVSIDGVSTGSQTGTKRSVIAGQHTFSMTRDGYRPWQRTLSVQSGTLTWLDYVRLVPTNLQKQTIRSYERVDGVSTAPDNQTIIVQQNAAVPSFDVVDIRAAEVKSQSVTLPSEDISELSTEGVTHRYEMDQWDESGRYLLITHRYNDSTEWIVFDTENVQESVNVTRLLSIQLADLQFAGTSGNVLFGLTDGVVRKLDLGNATISRGLVSNVTSFEMYETNTFTYIAAQSGEVAKRTIGLYRDGDREPSIIREISSDAQLYVDTARYHSDDYIAYAIGSDVTVLKGKYPTRNESVDQTMDVVETFSIKAPIEQLTFSPRGDYVLARGAQSFMTYEVEYDRLHDATVETSERATYTLGWLDDAHLTTTYDGHLSMRDFDGTNVHVIMPIIPGYDATLSQNGRYIYGVNKTDDTFRLERVTMILQ